MPADRTLKDLDGLRTKGKMARAKLEPTWALNLAFYAGGGRQWLAWDGRGLFRPQLAPSRMALEQNFIQPAVRTEIAKMTKVRPTFIVSPNTTDEEDQDAAELGGELMIHLWKHLHLRKLMLKALFWSRVCSAGFVKTLWDPTVGPGIDVIVGPNGKVISGPDGPLRGGQSMVDSLGFPAGTVQSKRANQGECRVEVRSPFQMFIDPLADTFEEAEWLVEESVKSVGYVEQRYNFTATPDAMANPGLVESMMSGATSQSGGSYMGVRVSEYWCRPCKQHPHGLRVVWCKGKELHRDEEPFDPWPYVMLSGIPVPGRLWPSCIVEQLRGPQTELNKVISQIAENRSRIGNPTILASRQAIPDPDKFAASISQVGGIQFFDDTVQNAVPSYLVAPPLPNYVVDEIARIREAMQEISGQHDVNSATVPAGVTAASAINLLQEADDTRIAPDVADYEEKLGEVGQKLLALVGKYYTDARMIRIGGDQGVWQVKEFRGAMLRDNTHVEVQAGSSFPQSRAAKQAQATDLMNYMVQAGNPLHGRDLALFLKDYEIGGADRLIDEYTRDESQAKRENIRMLNGEIVHIHDFDDHQAHIDSHEDEMKTQRWELQSDLVRGAFELHLKAHKTELSNQQQAQLQMQLQMEQGLPPNLTPAALQADQQLSQLQGQQQLQQGGMQQAIQAAQAQHQLTSKGAQQGHQMQLQAAQQQQQMRHAEELHQQKLSQQQEFHKARLAQANQPKGGPNGRQ